MAMLRRFSTLKGVKDFPTAPGAPIFGNLFDDPKLIHDNLLKYAKAVGPNYYLNMFISKILVIGDPELAQHCLIQEGKNVINRSKVPVLESIGKSQGAHETVGLVFANGPRYWGVPRKATQPLLQTPYLRRAEGVVAASADKLLSIIKSSPGSEKGIPINMSQQLHRITLDIIGELAFCTNLGALDGKQDEISTIIHDLTIELGKLLFMPFPYWDYIPSPTYKKTLHLSERLVQCGLPIVEARRKILASQPPRKPSDDDENVDSIAMSSYVIDLLLEARDDEGKEMKGFELVFNALQILMAGHDTTATTLGFTLLNLAVDLEAQKKAREEVDRVIGKDKINHNHLTQLEFITGCFKETLRLTPPGYVFGRETVEEDSWNGYRIPAKQTLFFSPIVLGRNEKFWHDDTEKWQVDEWKPERFLKKGRGATHPAAWLPFGAGIRGCIGARLAQMEMKIILASLLQKYEIIRDTSYPMPKLANEFFLKPSPDVRVLLIPRK